MNKLVLTIALLCVSSVSYANQCADLFRGDNPLNIIRGDKEEFYSVTEIEMTRDEFEALRREAQARREAKPESRVATHQNKSARADGNVVVIESLIAGNKKVYQKEFDIKNANGNFEQSMGQYWIMPHNEGRLVVWNFARDRVYDIKLPDNTVLVDVTFDLTSNIFQPRMLIEYRKQAGNSEMVDVLNMEIDLVSGKAL